jgi:hypothetical protein
MIEISKRAVDHEAVPQAIFWRPLKYFSLEHRHESDDLDNFSFICYTIGNECNLEVRSYRGHNRHTTTLFLARDRDDQAAVDRAVDLVIQHLKIPRTAVAWRRGMPFEFGVLERNPSDRLVEGEATQLVLKIASQCKDWSAKTSFLKNSIHEYYETTEEDRKVSPSRAPELLWRQIVGNVISHKTLFKRELAEPIPRGLRLLPKALVYLKSVGFLS